MKSLLTTLSVPTVQEISLVWYASIEQSNDSLNMLDIFFLLFNVFVLQFFFFNTKRCKKFTTIYVNTDYIYRQYMYLQKLLADIYIYKQTHI